MEPPEAGRSAAVFLDRDGTLMEDVDYCHDPETVRVFPGAPEALQRLKRHGFRNIIITNQSGLARGLITVEEFDAVQRKLGRDLGKGMIDDSYHCVHLPEDGCDCRKPRTAMIRQAVRDHGIDLKRSFFIGDKSSDIECGRNAGVRTVLVLTGYGRAQRDCKPDFVAEDISEAVEWILKVARASGQHERSGSDEISDRSKARPPRA